MCPDTNPDGFWWFSTERITVGVEVKKGLVTQGPPIVQKFIGQPVMDLARWMRKQPGFRSALVGSQPVTFPE